MSVRKAQRPLNGRETREPTVLLGFDGNTPRVTITFTDGKASFARIEVLDQFMQDLQVAYGHLATR